MANKITTIDDNPKPTEEPDFLITNDNIDVYLEWLVSLKRPHLIWRHIDPTGGPLACWPWAGSKAGGHGKEGRYGQVQINGKRRTAHHVIWEIEHEMPMPLNSRVLHTCKNSLCCNPAHLYLVQNGETKDSKIRNEVDALLRAKGYKV